MKKITSLFALIIAFSFSEAQVSFNTQSVSVSGTDLAVIDMNNDQRDDLVGVTTSQIQIHYQQANGSFSITNYPISATYGPSWSLAAGDYNADGFIDLVWGSTSGAHVYRANGSGSTISSFSQGATSHTVFTQRTNFVDINNDGHMDVFVCDDIEPNEYWLNDGNGNLTLFEGADPNGIPEGLGVYSSGGNYGSIWIDYDNDRDNDLFIAKCGGSSARRTNQLHRNNGSNSFTEVGLTAGLADDMQTWSSAWGDYDNDGDMDCFVGSSSSSYQHKLMRNNGDGTFTDVSVASGVTACQAFYHENVFVDFDNDGLIDIFVNGDILYNDGDGTFTVDETSGLSGFGGAFGDVNDDGFIDMFRTDLYINQGNSNNYIKICTEGTDSNINGIGARIEITTAAGTQIRDVRSGEGFRYMNSLTTHFGIGSETEIQKIEIFWPSGNTDLILNPAINETICVVEGETLSLEDSLVEDLILYPNPTKGILNLNATYGFENAIYSVFDIQGKRVMNSKFNTNSIDVSELNSGTYILRIMQEGMIKTQKFIKQ